MIKLEQDIESLLNAQAYSDLYSLTPPFNLFNILGIKHRELSHSKVLAWLFSDPNNSPFRSSFLKWLEPKLEVPHIDQIDENPDVFVEYGDSEAGRIDVFVEFREARLVIAIENKIWASELEGQIGRYQGFLRRRYKSYYKVVIFLTPTGYSPTTSHPNQEVPIICMAWGDLANLIAKKEPTGVSAHGRFLTQFVSHIKKDIVMTETEEQKIVRKLLQNKKHAKTIRTIMDNLPSLGRFEDSWKNLLFRRCDLVKSESEIQIKPYKTRGVTKELKVKISRWCDAGLPFTIMLHEHEHAAIRIMLDSGDLDAHKEYLRKFALANSELVNTDYPPVRGWSPWHAVMKEDGEQEEPEHTLIHGTMVDSDWEKLVAERLSDQVPKLAAAINIWISDRPVSEQTSLQR